MKTNPNNFSVIERFGKQRQRMKKIMVAILGSLAVMISVPLVLSLFPVLRNHPAWNGIGTAWLCLFAIICTGFGVAAFINQGCPACAKPIGELFWTAQYCPHCGTKLSED